MLFRSRNFKVNHIVRWFEAEHVFVPHFTIAQGLSSQEFEDIFGQVALAGVDHKEIIDELTLLSFDDDEDKWKVIETFKLA